MTQHKEQSLEQLVRKRLHHFIEELEDCEMEDMYGVVIAQVEKPLLELVLQRCQWNQLKAAQALGINRNTLRKKIRSHQLKKPAFERGLS